MPKFAEKVYHEVKNRFTSAVEKIAFRFFVNQAERYRDLSRKDANAQVQLVKSVRYKAVALSALYGALGVLLLYLPQYFLPEWFPQKEYPVPFFDWTVKLSVNELIFGLVLVALEIWLLAVTDFRAVGKIAAIYGYRVKPDDELFFEETSELVHIGLGKERRLYEQVGLNPLQSNTKAGVYLLLIIFRLKALMSKFVFRFVLKKLLGRLAVRAVLDLAGVPIYAFWNAYASAVVIRKVKMRMHARRYVPETVAWFYEHFADSPDFKALIYDTLEFTVITKKSFYPTDYFFAKAMLTAFNIPLKEEHKLSDDYFEKLKKQPEHIRKAVAKLMIIGFMIEGRLGSLEKRTLKKLRKEGIIPFEIDAVQHRLHEYIRGRGFEAVLSL